MATTIVKKYPFMNVSQAIRYLQNNNPARARSVNPNELDRGQKPASEQFSGDHPDDIYASVAYAIKRLFRLHADKQSQIIWTLYWIGPRDTCLSKEAIAKQENIHIRVVRRVLREMNSDLESELVWRELLPDPRLFDKHCH